MPARTDPGPVPTYVKGGDAAVARVQAQLGRHFSVSFGRAVQASRNHVG